ncbi:DUF1844 domain-containing protein [Actinomarinicola tropica]|uniref:DUF1844 domain-containing protein n=1 Tax=Actinomarinicola tropica TaxID=2789776 RepID=A0A5Q2RM83_9ACTN|nr:DUF1844 domain-containing protein [Actinomarinicola tropica]QGG95197.1 hypothetical protein GH723_08850 [Actinomarinicola tropica]
MSLWTPGGEHPVDRDRDAGSSPGTSGPADAGGPDILAGLSEEQRAEFDRLSPEDQEQAKLMIAQMAESRRQVLSTPAAVVIGNHAMGLYELAAIHLGAEQPQLEEAKLAIDALAALLDAVDGHLGEDGDTMRDALAQIQLAFVQIRAGLEGEQQGPPTDQPEG